MDRHNKYYGQQQRPHQQYRGARPTINHVHYKEEVKEYADDSVLGQQQQEHNKDAQAQGATSTLAELVQERLSGTCVQVYGDKATNNKALKNPVGVAQLPDGSVIVCDTFNNRLVQFSEAGKLTRIFNATPSLNKPSAAVVLTNPSAEPDMAAFAVKDHYDIYMFDSNCKHLRSLTKRTLRRPYGLTMDDNCMLVTVETGRQSVPCITRIHSTSGDITRVNFDLATQLRRPSIISKPRFIAYHRQDVLIVVDLGLDLVVMVSMCDGAVLRQFGESGSGPRQFRDPSGVVCDADGYIILADSRNHRIQVFSPEGEFLSVLRVDRPLKRPSGLYLTPCGHLLVINYWENTIAKYKLSV